MRALLLSDMDYIRIIPSVAVFTFMIFLISVWIQDPFMLHDVTRGMILTEHHIERIKVNQIDSFVLFLSFKF